MYPSKNWLRAGLAVCALAAACSAPEDRSDGEQASGIARVEVVETGTALEISGLGPTEEVVAHVTLVVGPFVMAEDGRSVDGRQMSVDVMGKQFGHESEGRKRLSLPLFGAQAPEVDEFLADPRVAPVLERWDVTFTESPPVLEAGEAPVADEAGYNYCSPQPNPGGCPSANCEQGNPMYTWSTCDGGSVQAICCGNHTNLKRACFFGWSNPCGTEGAGGCAVCWTGGWNNGCQPYIYQTVMCSQLSAEAGFNVW